MFKLTIEAATAEELKNKALELAESLESTVEIGNVEDIEIEPNLIIPHDVPAPREFIDTKLEAALGIDREVPELNVTPEFQAPKHSVDINIAAQDVDVTGLPWDERIHSAGKSKTTDGHWRTRRNISPELVQQVETELKSKGRFAPVVAPPVIIPPVPPTTVHVELPNFDVAPTVVVETPKSVSYDPIQIPQGNVRPTHSLETFRKNLVPLLTQLINEKKIDKAYIDQLNNYFGTTALWQLAQDDAKSAELFENFAQFGFITKVG